jgi:flagellar protein FliJ
VAAADREVGVKRASFRLQPVLELRRTQERTAALAAAQAANTAADAHRQATERETALAAAVLPPSLTPGEFVATMTLFRLAADDASAARSLAIASAEQAELVRSQWTEAAQRTKGLERLRERHQVAMDAAEAAAEERAVDDLVTGRAGRAGSADQNGDDPWTE